MSQAFIASLVLALGLIYGGAYLRDRMLEDRLQTETAQLGKPRPRWDAHVPGNSGIASWILPAGDKADAALPADLRGYGRGSIASRTAGAGSTSANATAGAW